MLPEMIFDELPRSGAIAKGKYLSIFGKRMIVEDGALEDAWIGSAFHIGIRHDETAGYTSARVYTNYWPITRESLERACSRYETVRAETLEGLPSVSTYLVNHDGNAGLFVRDLVDAFLLLDGVLVDATAFEAYDEPDLAFGEFDIKSLLESFGFGKASDAIAKDFFSYYDQPHEQAMASYALPYNLQRMADSGVLDAVIAENGPSFFTLDAMAWKRWRHCESVISALQGRGFTNEQIAFVVCHNYDFFHPLETRQLAEEMRGRIISSSFDPEDPDMWSMYAATK